MDPRFTVTAQPRALPPGVSAEASPLVLAWRAMEAWQRELRECRQASAEADQRATAAWVTLADEYYRLTRLVEHVTAVLEQDDHHREAEDCRLMLRRCHFGCCRMDRQLSRFRDTPRQPRATSFGLAPTAREAVPPRWWSNACPWKPYA